MFPSFPITKRAGKSRGGAAVQTPAEIFGASLIGWWDAREGVTVDTGKVTNWANQGSGGDLTDPTTLRPNYVAEGVDGTPEVDFYATGATLLFGDAILDDYTVWIFQDQFDGTGVRFAFWSDIVYGLTTSGSSSDHPGFYAGGYQNAVATNIGWHSNRWTASRTGIDTSSIAVDDDAEELFTITWTAAQNWTRLSRTPSQPMRAPVKQIIMVNELVDDADSRHADVLAFLKDVYPGQAPY